MAVGSAGFLPVLLALLLSNQVARGYTDCLDMLCRQCDKDYKRCASCSTGHYLDGQGNCKKCKDPLAWECLPNGKSTLCQEVDFAMPDGKQPLVYLTKEGVCKHCPVLYGSGCKACGSDGKCATCEDNKYLDATNNKCKACRDPQCQKCRPDGTCLKCYEYWSDDTSWDTPTAAVYKAANGTCVKCLRNPWSSGCMACDSTGACTKCHNEDGGRMLENGRCVFCKDKLCEKCGPASKCLQCQRWPYYQKYNDNFNPVYRDAQGKCTACKHSTESGCQACNAKGDCIECGGGTFLHNGRCVPCDALVDDCTSCTKKGRCTGCGLGYGLKGNRCLPCNDPLCEFCTSTEVCTRCKDYAPDLPGSPYVYQDPKGRCTAITIDGCLKARPDGSCETCYNGYKPQGKGCAKCAEGESTCVRCENEVPICDRCSSDGKRCTQCSAFGYFDKKCRRCKDLLCWLCHGDYRQCESCDSQIDGRGLYKDAATGKCMFCPEGCNACDEKGVCEWCNQGFVKVGNTCKRCADPLCNACDPKSMKCLECMYMTEDAEYSVFKTRKGSCAACTVKGCQTCAVDGTCKQCRLGYLKKGGACVV